MHGLGNDFIVIDAMTQQISLTPHQIRALSHRRTGIGFDQLLLLEKSTSPFADFNYRIFNADGSEAETCGNGARCMGLFIKQHALSNKEAIKLATKKGLLTLHVLSPQQIRVEMGIPREESSFEMMGYQFYAVDMGNPHVVTFVDGLESIDVSSVGKAISEHSRFPHQTNVNFVHRVNQGLIKLRVYERGVGETMACGSGACASAVASLLHQPVKNPLKVEMKGGCLIISWAGPSQPLWMEGSATYVFEGSLS